MSPNRPAHPADPLNKPGGILCPYCGAVSTNPRRCDACAGYFDPLSRQASQNAMGPWFLRDLLQPFRPGCSYETLKELIRRGKVTRGTVLRGPTTRQFWSFAGRTPSVANLLGMCHNCQAEVNPGAFACSSCGAAFSPEIDRQHLGLAPVHLLPGQAPPEIIAAASAGERQLSGTPGRGGDPERRSAAPAASGGSETERGRATRRPIFWIALAITGGMMVAIGAAVVNWALQQPVTPTVTLRNQPAGSTATPARPENPLPERVGPPRPESSAMPHEHLPASEREQPPPR